MLRNAASYAITYELVGMDLPPLLLLSRSMYITTSQMGGIACYVSFVPKPSYAYVGIQVRNHSPALTSNSLLASLSTAP